MTKAAAKPSPDLRHLEVLYPRVQLRFSHGQLELFDLAASSEGISRGELMKRILLQWLDDETAGLE